MGKPGGSRCGGVIVSASRRTDIPAFYGEWFMERVAEGDFIWKNPFNPADTRIYSLKPEAVDGFVFWSKNPGPFLKHLPALDKLGYHYYFQYTLNDYPPFFEPAVPPLQQRLAVFCELSDRLGPDRVVWRYDPIIASTATPAAWHLDRIGKLAAVLEGRTKRCVISFLDFYRRAAGRLREAEEEQRLDIVDITAPEQRGELDALARGIGGIGRNHGMEVFTCTEKVDLSDAGIGHGACIDGELVRKLFGTGGKPIPDAGQRNGCRCVKSVDMGVYGTCRHGCIYCYAT